MSHDIELVDKTLSGQSITVHELNFTYNYSPALHAAGFKWEQCDGKTAAEVGVLVNALIVELRRDRPKYEPLILGEGTWGTWDLLLPKLERLAAACKTHHAAKFRRY